MALAPHPPGTIGVLTGDLARWTWFQQSLLSLVTPPDSQIIFCSGVWIAAAVNKLIAAMRPDDAWICLLADDHIFGPDMLLRLLDHAVPLVAPLCCLRRLPYAPSLFARTPHGNEFRGYTWDELRGLSGLLAVDAMGGPGVVIRRAVLDALGAPWFECMPGHRESPHEDLYFFTKCATAGFQPFVDLDLPIGHILPAAVFPQPTPTGDYRIRLWAHDDVALFTPLATPQPVEDYHAHT